MYILLKFKYISKLFKWDDIHIMWEQLQTELATIWVPQVDPSLLCKKEVWGI